MNPLWMAGKHSEGWEALYMLVCPHLLCCLIMVENVILSEIVAHEDFKLENDVVSMYGVHFKWTVSMKLIDFRTLETEVKVNNYTEVTLQYCNSKLIQ